MSESTTTRTVQPTEDRVLDCRGLLCPMPIVKTSKEIKSLAPGQILKVIATDRGAIADMPAFVADTGNSLLEWHQEGFDLIFYIRKEAQAE
jgi:TusA-related sulfurtransferase